MTPQRGLRPERYGAIFQQLPRRERGEGISGHGALRPVLYASPSRCVRAALGFAGVKRAVCHPRVIGPELRRRRDK